MNHQLIERVQNFTLDRKILADMAMNDAASFATVVASAKAALEA